MYGRDRNYEYNGISVYLSFVLLKIVDAFFGDFFAGVEVTSIKGHKNKVNIRMYVILTYD